MWWSAVVNFECCLDCLDGFPYQCPLALVHYACDYDDVLHTTMFLTRSLKEKVVFEGNGEIPQFLAPGHAASVTLDAALLFSKNM